MIYGWHHPPTLQRRTAAAAETHGKPDQLRSLNIGSNSDKNNIIAIIIEPVSTAAYVDGVPSPAGRDITNSDSDSDSKHSIAHAAVTLYEQGGRARLPTVDTVRRQARVSMNDANTIMKQ